MINFARTGLESKIGLNLYAGNGFVQFKFVWYSSKQYALMVFNIKLRMTLPFLIVEYYGKSVIADYCLQNNLHLISNEALEHLMSLQKEFGNE